MGMLDVFFSFSLEEAAIKLTKFLFKQLDLIGTIAVLFSAGRHVAAIVGTIDYAYDKGYLKQMVIIVVTDIGWWALAKFFAKILSWLVPGLGEAALIASLTVLIAQLTILIAEYPG